MLDFKNCFAENDEIVNFTQEVRINHAVGIFYVLELLYVLTLKKYSEFLPSQKKLLDDIKQYKDIWSNKLGQLIYDYIALVVGAELRHASKCSEYCHPNFYGEGWYKNMSRGDCYADREFSPKEILKLGLILFNPDNNGWREGYGGEKWFNIAKAGLMYNQVPIDIFIDHTVDLSHNNSVFFDKGAYILNCDVDKYKSLLDKKFRMVDFGQLFMFCCEFETYDMNVYNLLFRYNKLFANGRYEIDYLKDKKVLKLNNRLSCRLLRYKPQKFGKKHISISEIIPTGRVFDAFGEEIKEESERDEEDEW